MTWALIVGGLAGHAGLCVWLGGLELPGYGPRR